MRIMVDSIVCIVAALSTICLGYGMIPWLRQHGASGKRFYTPESHDGKSATPSFGGLLFIPIILCTGIVSAWFSSDWVMAWPVWILVSFAGIGLYDDIHKLWYQQGISERCKFTLQVICAAMFAVYWYMTLPDILDWFTPIGVISVPVGIWVIPWAIFVIVGSSNAVNLTDGVDGLAATSILWHSGSSLVLVVMYATYYSTYADAYTIWLASIAGAMLGFLWHNAYPAYVFMGDVGSISLGAVSAVIAILAGLEWMLPFTLCVPLIETASVIVQVVVFKMCNVRLFKLAPIHHHYELSGWHESHIVTRAAVVSAMSVALVIMSISIYGI